MTYYQRICGWFVCLLNTLIIVMMIEAAQATLVGNRTIHFPFRFYRKLQYFLHRIELSSCEIILKIF